jgi:hypothetical protein
MDWVESKKVIVEEGLDELGLNDAPSGVGLSLKEYPCLNHKYAKRRGPPFFSFALKYHHSIHRPLFVTGLSIDELLYRYITLIRRCVFVIGI